MLPLWRALLPLLLLAQVAVGQSADLGWPDTTSETKPWTRWWWMGSAVDSANLTAGLGTLAAGGGPPRGAGGAGNATGPPPRGASPPGRPGACARDPPPPPPPPDPAEEHPPQPPP